MGGRPAAASPPTDAGSARDARLAERQAQAGRERRRRLLVRGAVGAAALVLLVVAGVRLYDRLAEPATWQTFPDQGNLHLAGPESAWGGYNSDPPTSGPHAPQRPAWGVHGAPIPKGLQVHGLEDGGVLVQYNCPAGCPDLVAQLRAIVARYPEQVILAPYPGMPTRIALTAWTRFDAFDDFDEARIVRFIARFRGIDHHR